MQKSHAHGLLAKKKCQVMRYTSRTRVVMECFFFADGTFMNITDDCACVLMNRNPCIY